MSAVPRFTRWFLLAALASSLALQLSVGTNVALSVLFGSLTSAINLLAFAWIVKSLAVGAETGRTNPFAVALAPVKFIGVIALVLFLISRPFIHPLLFLAAHGVVLIGVALLSAFAERAHDKLEEAISEVPHVPLRNEHGYEDPAFDAPASPSEEDSSFPNH